MISAEQFFSHFKAVGFLQPLTWSPSGGGASQSVDVHLTDPHINLLDGMVQAREYEIEYPSTQLPGLAEGETVYVGAVGYKVRQPPYRVSSGAFTRALLQPIPVVVGAGGGQWDFSNADNSGHWLLNF